MDMDKQCCGHAISIRWPSYDHVYVEYDINDIALTNSSKRDFSIIKKNQIKSIEQTTSGLLSFEHVTQSPQMFEVRDADLLLNLIGDF